MSRTVDSRVVEMVFDNAKFEKNVAQTQKTLKNLKTDLDFTKEVQNFNQISEASKGIDLSALSNSVSALSERFTTMGIVGMTVIQNLTNAIMNTLMGAIGSAVSVITTGGKNRALNLEKAKFQIEGLGKTWDEVSKQIDFAVTDTAYSLDQAALAAGAFVTSGVQIGNVSKVISEVGANGEMAKDYIDDLGVALKAVSGVAAQTQSDYSRISNIFQDVASAGYLTGQAKTSLQLLGLPVVQDLANYYGRSADEINKMISQKMISFNDFAGLMYDKYAEHASAANKTFEGVKANIRAAFSKIGADFYQPLIQNGGALVKMLDAFRAKVNDLRKVLKPASELLVSKIVPVLEKLGAFINSWQISSITIDLDKLGKVFDFIINNLVRFGTFVGTKTINAFKSIGAAISTATKHASEWWKTTRNLASNIGVFIYLKDVFTQLGYLIGQIGLNIKHFFGTILVAVFKDLGGVVKNFTDNLFPATSTKLGFWISARDLFINLSKHISKLQKKLVDVIFYLNDTSTPLNYFASNFMGMLKSLAGAFGKLLNQIDEMSKSLTSLVKSLLPPAEKIINSINKALITMGDIFKDIKTHLDDFIRGDTTKKVSLLSSAFSALGAAIKGSANIIGGASGTIFKFFSGFGSMLGEILEVLSKIVGPIGKLLDEGVKLIISAVKGLASALNNGALANSLEGSVFVAILISLNNVINNLIKSNPLKIVENVQGVITSLSKTLYKLQKEIDIKMLKSIGEAILMLAGAMFILSAIDADRLGDTSLAMAGLFTELTAAFEIMKKSSGTFKGLDIVFILSLSLGLLLVASALKSISNIDTDKLAGSLIAFTLLLSELVGAYAILNIKINKLEGGPLAFKGSFAFFIGLAAAIYLLASAVKKLSTLEPLGLFQGLIGVITLLGSVVGALYILQTKIGKIKVEGLGIFLVELAIVIGLLANVVKKLGELSGIQLIKGEGGVALLLGELLGFLKLFNVVMKDPAMKPKYMKSVCFALIELAATINLLAIAVEKLGMLPLGNLAQGTIAIGALMYMLTKFVEAAGVKLKPEKLTSTCFSLIELAAAVNLLARAVKIFGEMDLGTLLKGGIAVGVVLYAFSAIAESVTASAGSLLSMGASFILMATAMNLLIPPFVILGNMDIKQLGGALLVMLGTLAGFVLLATGLQGCTAALLSFSTALIGLGIGLDLIAASILIFATGLKIIISLAGDVASVSSEAFAALTANAGKLLNSLIESVMKAGNQIIAGILDGINLLIVKLTEIVPNLIGLLVAIGSKIITGLTVLIPQFAELVISIIKAICKTIKETISDVLDTVMFVLKKLLTSLRDNLGDFIKIGLEIIAKLILGFASGIGTLVDAGIKLLIDFINGVADALANNADGLLDAIFNLAGSIISFLFTSILALPKKLIEIGGWILGKIGEGFKGAFGEVANWVAGLFAEIGKGIEREVDAMRDFGRRCVEGFKKGFEDPKYLGQLNMAVDNMINGYVVDPVTGKLIIHSPSRLFKQFGEYVVEGFAIGISDNEDLPGKAMDSVTSSLISKTKDYTSRLSAIIEDDFNPVIAPTLDLTDVKRGMKDINSLFGNNQNLYGDIQNGGANGAPTYIFNQTNNSPKALSNTEIYRQTKNQFSQFRRAVQA